MAEPNNETQDIVIAKNEMLRKKQNTKIKMAKNNKKKKWCDGGKI